MASIREFLLQEGFCKYEEAKLLNEVQSKEDPPNEPFKSKYKARDIFEDLRNKLKKLNEDTTNLQFRLLASIDFLLGVNYMETDELAAGEELLMKCFNDLEPVKLNQSTCGIVQNVLNQLGILWAGRRNSETALKFLRQAECLYRDYKHEVGGSPFTIDELFEGEIQNDEGTVDQLRSTSFEDSYTHTLFYLAQVYGNLEEKDSSAEYCQMTLQRQLESHKFDPVDWALNAATLSQYYIATLNFPLARHCLASASQIFQEANQTDTSAEGIEDDSQTATDAKEKILQADADIHRCWVKYGLALLEASWDKISKLASEEESSEDKLQDSEEKLKTCFNLELTSYEDKVTDKFVCNFNEARLLFLEVQKWINKAKEFYVLVEHCNDHVEVTQDSSKLFKLLANFESSFERQCKMHKRRIDMLDSVLQKLNQQYYLLVCRQLMFEIAECYSSIIDLKLAIAQRDDASPSIHAVRKINYLLEQSISYYDKYLDTLKDTNKQLPDILPDDDERPGLIAHFCIGRLYGKFIETDTTKRLDNLNKSIKYYKYLIDYCKKNPNVIKKVRHERDVCEELIELLPYKMERIRLGNE